MRAIIQDILEKQGGIVAILPFVCLFLLILVVVTASGLLKAKQREIDRMATTKERLENEVLKKRMTSSGKTPRKGKK